MSLLDNGVNVIKMYLKEEQCRDLKFVRENIWDGVMNVDCRNVDSEVTFNLYVCEMNVYLNIIVLYDVHVFCYE